jgi:hypothetical protein
LYAPAPGARHSAAPGTIVRHLTFDIRTSGEIFMKILLTGLVVAGLGMANVAIAQDTTVVHKESANGENSKTVVKSAGSKTVIKRHGLNVKKVHTDAFGDKTVVKKTVN